MRNKTEMPKPAVPSAQTYAQQLLEQLQADFFLELPNKISVLEQSVMDISKTKDDSELIGEFYRQIHSLKGNAGTYSFHIITTICHQLEDQLQLVESPEYSKTAVIDSWLSYIDLLNEAVSVIETGQQEFISIENSLIQLQNKIFQGSLTGLLVESSQAVSQLCMDVAQKYNIRLNVVNDGYVALGRLIREKMDVLITANEVRGINGYALIAALKLSNSVNANMPTALITSDLNSTLSSECAPDNVIVRDVNLVSNLDKYCKKIVQKHQSRQQTAL